MSLNQIKEKVIARNNDFYRQHYQSAFLVLMGLIVLVGIVVSVLLYQMINRPLPQFAARQIDDGKQMLLRPFEEPNLRPGTILRWASKAATLAYTFDFVRYKEQTAAARPYFTENGWQDYVNSLTQLINVIVQNKLFVNGVVSGTPVISNEGPLEGKGHVWRVQIPFLVTYQSANRTTNRNFIVILSIVRVPTHVNEQGIGIDQFLMV
jgi:intracellular multiplication protein IcmL